MTTRDGRSFCAGGDLKDVRENLISTQAAAAMNQQMSDVLSRLSTLPSMLIAAQEGAAQAARGRALLPAAEHDRRRDSWLVL